jgi:hypothetical protein
MLARLDIFCFFSWGSVEDPAPGICPWLSLAWFDKESKNPIYTRSWVNPTHWVGLMRRTWIWEGLHKIRLKMGWMWLGGGRAAPVFNMPYIMPITQGLSPFDSGPSHAWED